jgi:hypothetical protein
MEFSIKGENGDYLKISLKEVHGFPESTSPFGGYDIDSFIEIKVGSYSVQGNLWITTGNIYDFFNGLQRCQKSVKGSASLRSYENNLSLTINYDQNGHTLVSGEFIELNYKLNSLKFQIESDQSFINETLSQLKRIHEVYGDNFGKKEI